MEQELAAQHLIDYVDLFQQIPTVDKSDPGAVLNFVKTWKQYRNVSVLNPEKIQDMINDLENKLDLVKKEEQEYTDLMLQKNASLMNMDELKDEGRKIVEDLACFAAQDFGPSAVSAGMAFASTLRETIDCLKVQVRIGVYFMLYLCDLMTYMYLFLFKLKKWDISFDPAQET